jgi:hypothetical protein
VEIELGAQALAARFGFNRKIKRERNDPLPAASVVFE